MKRRIEKVQHALQGLILQNQAKKVKGTPEEKDLETKALEILHGVRKEAKAINRLIKNKQLSPLETIQEKDLQSLLKQGIL